MKKFSYLFLAAASIAMPTIANNHLSASFDRQLFGEKVLIFSPDDNMDSIAASLREIDAKLFGREMDADRYAVLFRPGDYKGAGLINVPFYVHVAGLGATP